MRKKLLHCLLKALQVFCTSLRSKPNSFKISYLLSKAGNFAVWLVSSVLAALRVWHPLKNKATEACEGFNSLHT